MAQEDQLSVEDFTAFLRWLDDEGIPFVVIGGCAVGAYARLRGQTVFSADLDIYTTPRALDDIVAAAPAIGLTVRKLPQPRSVLVAVLDWEGKEINVLCSSAAMPAPQEAIRAAHEVALPSGLSVPVSDPIDLLADKLAVGRDKDVEHVGILKDYIEAELELIFGGDEGARQRHAPVRRYLAALGTDELPDALAVARAPADLRFLAARCRSGAALQALCDKAKN
jgi:hypothetical protein